MTVPDSSPRCEKGQWSVGLYRHERLHGLTVALRGEATVASAKEEGNTIGEHHFEPASGLVRFNALLAGPVGQSLPDEGASSPDAEEEADGMGKQDKQDGRMDLDPVSRTRFTEYLRPDVPIPNFEDSSERRVRCQGQRARCEPRPEGR